MHFFTSVTVNYIPKARVLAASLKKFHPEARFHLVLSDRHPDWLKIEEEPFDSVINITELPIENLHPWIFGHSLVELCTAVKGFAFQEIFSRYNPDKVVYLDPDIAVLSTLESLSRHLDQASILLTPHQTEPDSDLATIRDNEICSLKHGVFNLGFLAVRNSETGRRFIDWWASRLANFCYDDIPNGLFTDQRWVDLAPCFFDELRVLREPVYNVCTWNLSTRRVSGTAPYGLQVNGSPICFYHFSGFDSGAQQLMLNVYGKESPVLRDLRDWYVSECREMGQETLGKTPCRYDSYSNGKKVTKPQRLLYRLRSDLREKFPDPFATEETDNYLSWYEKHYGVYESELDSLSHLELLGRAKAMLADLTAIRNSKSWRILKTLKIVKL